MESMIWRDRNLKFGPNYDLEEDNFFPNYPPPDHNLGQILNSDPARSYFPLECALNHKNSGDFPQMPGNPDLSNNIHWPCKVWLPVMVILVLKNHDHRHRPASWVIIVFHSYPNKYLIL